MKSLLMCAASAVALGATGAQADGLGNPPVNWTGFYAGAQGGAGFYDPEESLRFGGTRQFNLEDTVPVAGGVIGYNWQHGGLVLGAEADFSYLGVEDQGLSVVGAKDTVSVRGDSDWFATVRARVGIAQSSFLFFATAGLALMDSDLQISNTGIAAPAFASDSSVLAGIAGGGGIQYAFSDNWAVKAEYLFAAFEADDLGTPLATVTVDPRLHVLRLGIVYRF